MFFFLWVLLLRVLPSRVIKSNQPMPVLFLRRSLSLMKIWKGIPKFNSIRGIWDQNNEIKIEESFS